MKNLFCKRDDLTNEAAVERLFVDRLLAYLGYRDNEIVPKTAIEQIVVAKGSKKLNYKPDYVLKVDGNLRWLLDAKAPTETLDDWTEQCASYALAINRRAKKGQGISFFVLTNGNETRLYRWDEERPVLSLSFQDFSDGNALLAKLMAQLSRTNVGHSAMMPAAGTAIKLEHPGSAQVNAVFTACNNYIYKHDNISPAAAFHEFVKVVFLKIKADRELHRKYPVEMKAADAVPARDVVFSVAWLEGLEGQHDNPLDVQFQKLLEELEKEVLKGSKKRIFDAGERINLQPDTAKAVVGMLEHYDLFGIDEDLNGRLFEAFLSATMRGRELGQYFTPRSIVKLMTKLADPRVHGDTSDRVIDPCCGTGGFLIEAMSLLARQIDGNDSLSSEDKRKRHRFVREQALFGIDVGRVPPIARIARINMYLHGDGGSRIYIAEALDEEMENQGHLSAEAAAEIAELKRVLAKKNDLFDVVLTNPPFSKEYDPKIPSEKRILCTFQVAGGGAATQPLKSNVLFIERYRDLVRPGGKVLAVVDDSLLGGKKFAAIRDFVRANFIVRAVVSLPGDAFQRSGARVKTSIIYLTRRASPEEEQPSVFMWYCTAIGIDDSARQRVLPEDAQNRQAAVREIADVVEAFQRSQRGEDKSRLVSPEKIRDRLDVKSCVLKPGRRLSEWRSKGLTVEPLSNLVEQRVETWTGEPSDSVQLLSVTYDGQAVAQEIVRESIKYGDLFIVRTGDVVISHINAVNGAICVLPEELDGAVVSPEYTVLRPLESQKAHAIWAILRSPEVRADILTRSSGLGRHRIDPDVMLNLPVPTPTNKLRDTIKTAFSRAIELETEAARIRGLAQAQIEQEMALASEEADRIILAFKPPR